MTDYNNPDFDPLEFVRDTHDYGRGDNFEFDRKGDFGYRELASQIEPDFYKDLKSTEKLRSRHPK